MDVFLRLPFLKNVCCRCTAEQICYHKVICQTLVRQHANAFCRLATRQHEVPALCAPFLSFSQFNVPHSDTFSQKVHCSVAHWDQFKESFLSLLWLHECENDVHFLTYAPERSPAFLAGDERQLTVSVAHKFSVHFSAEAAC